MRNFFSVILNSFQDPILEEARCRNKFGMTKRITSGFTLIELLVVIAIIGVLAGLLVANFVGVRQRARDGVRKSDVQQIRSALELYRSDQSAYRPSPLPACGASMTGGVPVITYMQSVPCDPQSNTRYNYVTAPAGVSYCIRACLENVNDAERDELPAKYGSNNPTIAGCGGLPGCSASARSYTLQSP